MANVHCLVFEPDASGHRLQHVRHLIDALLEIGCDVTLALQSDCRSHAEFTVHLTAIERHVRLLARVDPPQSRGLAARRKRVAQLLEILRETSPQWVYAPYMDGITQAATLESLLYGGGPFRRVPIEVQLMRGRYGYPPMSMTDALYSATIRWLTLHNPWHVTHMLDPIALAGLEPLPEGARFRLIPEPVERLPQVDRSEARQVLGVPADGQYLSVIGGLLPWKGIDLLLAAFRRARLRADDRLLLVGKMHPAIHALLHDQHGDLLRQGRVTVVARYVSDLELDCAFLASDAVAVTYPRPMGSAGSVVRAAAAQRPVLGTNFGWIGWATATFQLGTTVEITDQQQYAAAIEKTFDGAGTYHQTLAAARFCAYHTVANAQAHWVRTLGEEHSVPLGRMTERIDWNWVLSSTNEMPGARVRRT